MTEQTLSQRLANHVVKHRTMDDGLESWMRLLLLDYLAVTAGGAGKDSAAAVRGAVTLAGERSVAHPATVHGTGRFASVEDAAFVNGVTAHGLELDDTFEEGSSHPAVVVFPAVLAVADEDGSTAEAVLAAAAVGYDVMCSIGTLLGAAESYRRGFHPTAVTGVVGAAAAVASLLGLDERQAAHALGLAANMAAGSLEFLSDGSWTKRLNAGHAAATGIRAARLAAAGFEGPVLAFEGRDGFLRQYGDGLVEGRALRLEHGRGALDTSIKFYPCCRYMHGNIDLLRGIHAERPDLALENIESIRVGVIKAGAALVSEPRERKLVVNTPVDAQFNMPFGAAVALATGQATVEQFDGAPEVARELAGWMEKVECYTSDVLEAAFPARWQAEVSVRLHDGSTIDRTEEAFRGSPHDRATLDDLVDKAGGLVGRASAAALSESVAALRLDRPMAGQVSIPTLLPTS